jgi:hypothetical protein
MAFLFAATGSDPAKVKALVDEINQSIQQMVPAIQAQAAQSPIMQPVVDFITSMKATADGGNATLTGEIKHTVAKAFFAEVGPYMFQSLFDDTPQPGTAGIPAQTAPAP